MHESVERAIGRTIVIYMFIASLSGIGIDINVSGTPFFVVPKIKLIAFHFVQVIDWVFTQPFPAVVNAHNGLAIRPYWVA